jgi:hypothetical protein
MLKQYIQTLADYQQFWQFSPFQNTLLTTYPWPQDLINALLELSHSDVERIDSSFEYQREFFTPWFGDVFSLPKIPQALAPSHQTAPFWLTNGIAGRKLEQISAFIEHVPQQQSVILEWCSGKGHLGRLLAYAGQRQVISVEWQQQLCELGQGLAHQHQLPQQFLHADVMSADLSSSWAVADCAVALHACGDLHDEMLKQAVSHRCANIMIAPCCYHLSAAKSYLGFSQVAQRQLRNVSLALTTEQLKLAVQGQVTAGDRVARLRQTEVQWRLAYQKLYQQVTGDTKYRALPSVGKHWFSGNFEDFAIWAANYHQLELPSKFNSLQLLEDGRQAAERVARIELVRHVFRRPLEVMLVLDRAEYLKESGYRVSVAEFCSYQLTPRNFLIRATLVS